MDVTDAIGFIRWCGPFAVDSLANGEIRIRPRWPQFPPWSEGEGGGPGLASRATLAEAIAAVLDYAMETHPRGFEGSPL